MNDKQPRPNDQRSDVKNTNNPAFKADQVNRQQRQQTQQKQGGSDKKK